MKKRTMKKTLLSITVALLLLSSTSFASAGGFTTVRYTINTNYSNYYQINNQNVQHRYVTYSPYKYTYNRYAVPNTTNTNNINNNTTNTNNNINTTVSSTANTMELEVLKLINEERKKEGLAPFTYSEELSKVARTKSQDMADKNYFSHTSPTYGDPFTMMKSFGIKYRTAGENIAKGYYSASSVVNGWMNSEGHRANILNPSFNKIGIGYATNKSGTTYWTQMFID